MKIEPTSRQPVLIVGNRDPHLLHLALKRRFRMAKLTLRYRGLEAIRDPKRPLAIGRQASMVARLSGKDESGKAPPGW